MQSLRNVFKNEKHETQPNEELNVKNVDAKETGNESEHEETPESIENHESIETSDEENSPTLSKNREILHAPSAESVERTGIRQRIEEVSEATPIGTHNSADIVPLSQEFEANRIALRNLHVAAEAYELCLRDLHSKRVEMVKHMSTIAKGTPLFDAIGKQHDESEDDSAALAPAKSLEALVRACASNMELQSKQFDSSIVSYVEEWERVTSDRISSDLKQAGKLKERRTHYEDKVSKLRSTQHKTEEKDRPMSKAKVEKIERNDKKLKNAFDEHEEFSGKLAVLMEESSSPKGRWNDLMPLAKTYMKWESDRCESEHRFMSMFEEVASKIDASAKIAKEEAAKAVTE